MSLDDTFPELTPPIAFVTGGTRGIGREYVMQLLDRGYSVVYTGTSKESVSKGPGNAFGVVMRGHDIEHAIAQLILLSEQYKFSVAVLNASIEHVAVDIDVHTLENLLNCNLVFATVATRLLIKTAPTCLVVGCSSVATVIDTPSPEYTASRHYQSHFWRILSYTTNVALVETPVVRTDTLMATLADERISAWSRWAILWLAYEPSVFVKAVLVAVLDKKKKFVRPGLAFTAMQRLGLPRRMFLN